MDQKNLGKRPRRSSLTQHLQRILRFDGFGNRHGIGSQAASDAGSAPTPPQQEHFTEHGTQKPRTYPDVNDRSLDAHPKKHISYSYTSLDSKYIDPYREHPGTSAELSARRMSFYGMHTSSTPEGTPGKSDIRVSPTWNNISAQKKERRATLRLEAERVEVEKRLVKLERAESTKDPSSLRREPRRLTKKQPFGSSSRSSSVSADESRASKRFSSIFSSSRRSSRSRSSSLNEDDRVHRRRQSLDPGETPRPDPKLQHTTLCLSTTLPERFGTAISKELAVQSNPLIPNPLLSSPLHNSFQPEVGTAAFEGTGSRNTSDEDKHGQEPGRIEQVVADDCISAEVPKAQTPDPPAELNRLSFAATLNLEHRVSDKVQAPGRHGQSSSSQNATALAEGYHEIGTIDSSKPRQASVTASNTTNSRLRNSLTTLQPGSSRRALPSNVAQGRHKRFTSSPLAGFPAINNRTDSLPDLAFAEHASACSDGTRRPGPSSSEISVTFDISSPHSITSMSSSYLKERDNRQTPNVLLEVASNSKGTLRARLPNGSKLSDNNPGQHSSSAAADTQPEDLSVLNRSSDQRTQNVVEPAKPQSYRSLSDTLNCASRHASLGKGLTEKTALDGKDIIAFRRKPDSVGQNVPPLPRRNPLNTLNHGTGQSNASLSTNLSHEPESDEYNTADEAASSASGSRSDEYPSVQHSAIVPAPPSSSNSFDKCPHSGVYHTSQNKRSNISDFQSKNTAETPKQFRRDQLVAKLFVICCHCKFWHDMPAGVYAKLAFPTNSSAPSNSHPAPLVKKSGPNEHASYKSTELESMYDYLAKVILLGPSGAGKSCVLHRFVMNEWRVLSSQTIGVEFSSRIVKLGVGPRRTRIKLQLWDTAGTERFRSVSRSYYRGAAGAILIYDVSSHASFASLPTFLMDARALASPNLTVLLAGNKTDLTSDSLLLHSDTTEDGTRPPPTPSSTSSSFAFDSGGGSIRSTSHLVTGTRMTATSALHGREVSFEEPSRWAAKSNIPVAVEISALTGEGVEELFNRLARIILTKIELGEIDPDDPQSGIQYGDGGLYGHGASDGSSIRSRVTLDESAVQMQHRNSRRRGASNWKSGMREWEDVFRLSDSHHKNGEGCC
ncbi:hypothetical protein BBP40_012368 [Aspergillus hancockii]|nr:hypothetical protein BBP40_012368 [Aspergillus hancockii]